MKTLSDRAASQSYWFYLHSFERETSLLIEILQRLKGEICSLVTTEHEKKRGNFKMVRSHVHSSQAQHHIKLFADYPVGALSHFVVNSQLFPPLLRIRRTRTWRVLENAGSRAGPRYHPPTHVYPRSNTHVRSKPTSHLSDRTRSVAGGQPPGPGSPD